MHDAGARINERITAPRVRLLDQLGNDRGVVPIEEALRLAKTLGLALVEVVSREPPVCRLMEHRHLG